MIIQLQTQTENPSFEFRNIEKYSDGSGFGTILYVKSGGFTAEHPFFFEQHQLSDFISNLEQMNRTLKGKVILKAGYEDDYISFELDSQGHVVVFGELQECSQLPQKLRFSFLTDQTCLAPLLNNLKNL